jgi:hypothetical protein
MRMVLRKAAGGLGARRRYGATALRFVFLSSAAIQFLLFFSLCRRVVAPLRSPCACAWVNTTKPQAADQGATFLNQ